MQLTESYFATVFGVAEADLPTACKKAIASSDLRYQAPSREARDAIILQVLKHIDSDKPTAVGQHRANIWESCWSDYLKRFQDAGLSPQSLVPHFITPGLPARLSRDYVIPAEPGFELSILEICRAFLFDKYFRQAPAVYEFGCGSGFNLIALDRQLPGKKLFGLDWSKSSNETVDVIREKLAIDVIGRHFDFFDPDAALRLGEGSAVLTMCALEQVGSRHEAFLSYLLQQRPGVCVHMEPLLELYDDDHLVDHLAARYHRKRGYLHGFVPALRALETKGSLQILDVRRFYFGSFYHEGYSYVAWRPL